ncbi:MAG: M56 family metallopeptidase [Eudoraea sp.]|uniref:M56 family metallopeptidase n=1 Tax=Eudoraea sp. TaxID=1979955 RepID=UPI003C76E21F
MEAILIYILKATGILTLFYIVYQSLLKKETFYWLNRHFLLFGVLLAFSLPFFTINSYVEVGSLALEPMLPKAVNDAAANSVSMIKWTEIFFFIYGMGVVFLLTKMLLQLFSIRKIIQSNPKFKEDGYTFVETDKQIAPFSFFNYIFYNPSEFNKPELEVILKHEKAHSSQLHSIDLILAHMAHIFMWINPCSWLYKKIIEQNLEFLADKTAIENVSSRKTYKYTLLKVSGNNFKPSIINNFYNSLIKKRIVMLQKSKSNRTRALKALFILPLLGAFLISFNSRTIYIPTQKDPMPLSSKINKEQTIELLIDKNTTDKELESIKKDLKDKGIDFSYTVVHNENMEIIEIEIDFVSMEKEGKSFKGSSSFNNEGKPIDPIVIVYDGKTNTFFSGNKNSGKKALHKTTYENTWNYEDKDSSKVIEIKKDGDKQIIIIDGQEVDEENIEIITKDEDEKGSKLIIIKESENEEEIQVTSSQESSVFVLDTNSNSNMLYLLDGKTISRKEFEAISPDDIATINVYKGEKAIEKYGKKAKDGVIEIKLKKQN